MWVGHLEVVDFRSYRHADVALAQGPTVLVGRNGQGKTNLVEAVGYASTLASHRVSQEAALLARGRDTALIRIAVRSDLDRDKKLEIELNRGRGNRARLNGNQLPRTRDILGSLRSVIFAPEDMRLVRGDPSDRRRFLDDVMVQVAPRYLGLRSEYEKVLKQRNALLKSARGLSAAQLSGALEPWDKPLIEIGSELLWGRLNAARRLAEPVSTAYGQISDETQQATIAYSSTVGPTEAFSDLPAVREILATAVSDRRADEVARGVTLVGPHRDDLTLSLAGTPARGYASHGESWSFCLALRLASFEVMRGLTDEDPVLILDDVFAELDQHRRQRLVEAVRDADQVLVTAAVAQDVPSNLGGARFSVEKTDHSRIREPAHSDGS